MAVPSAGGGRTRIFIVSVFAAIILVVAIVVVVSIVNSSPAATPTPTPIPTATPTATPATKDLHSYFGVPGATATISGAATALTDFKSSAGSTKPPVRQVTVINVTQNSTSLDAPTFMSELVSGTPGGITASLSSDWTVMTYGQAEAFNAQGGRAADASGPAATILVLGTDNASMTNQLMQTWESSGLVTAAKGLLSIYPERRTGSNFASGVYRQVPLRYSNFPYPDQSIDWAIVLASNGKNYLVITNSRESMFYAIDHLSQ